MKVIKISSQVILVSEEKKLEFLKYRLQYIYKILKMFVSSAIIVVFGIIPNYYIFTITKLFENTKLVIIVVGIDILVILLLLGVSISNIIQLLQQFRLFKNNASTLAIDENSIKGDSD